MSVSFPVGVMKYCETKLRGKGFIMVHSSCLRSTTTAMLEAASHIVSAIRREQLVCACGHSMAAPRSPSFMTTFIYT